MTHPEQSDSGFQPTNAQGAVIDVLVRLIGFSGVHKREPQGKDVILDLLPVSHSLDEQPFCVRVKPDGSMVRITDEEAGLTERPSPMEALRLRTDAFLKMPVRVFPEEAEDADGNGPFGF